MTDAPAGSAPIGLRPLLGLCAELQAMLNDGDMRGCSFDPPTQTITIRGGPYDGMRFQPDAAGVFQRLES